MHCRVWTQSVNTYVAAWSWTDHYYWRIFNTQCSLNISFYWKYSWILSLLYVWPMIDLVFILTWTWITISWIIFPIVMIILFRCLFVEQEVGNTLCVSCMKRMKIVIKLNVSNFKKFNNIDSCRQFHQY